MREKFTQLLPLVVFTSAAVIGVGLVAAAWLISLGETPVREIVSFLLWGGVGTIAAGQIISLFHVRRIGRTLKAAFGLSHSWLSREVVLVAVFFLLAGLSAVVLGTAWGQNVWTILLPAATVFGVAAVAAMGFVYQLRGQIGWQGTAQFLAAPISTIFLASAIAGACRHTDLQPARVLFWLFLVFDALITILRYRQFMRAGGQPHTYTFPRFRYLAGIAIWIRLLLADVFGAVVFLMMAPLTAVLIVVAVLLDRTAFYLGAAQHTPKAEFARIKEERMRDAARG